ncbi:sterol desaturase family protein [Mangrovimicrobium sediminis]|uniref:Sterol desaturase family protein n=1 Tax=Mangrovimicrobium sediminis TaxID=2562682 RepID=A0A4Z0M660_9GAMM|nr:sterol desaturase family protein [Haliea sp. SAOS-164]TGD74878.1 sterol desaturase family protein [Haliea sp. SAOS-164]
MASVGETPDNLVYVFTAIAFAGVMALESLLPRRELAAGLANRWLSNFGIGALNWYLTTVLGTWVLIWLSQWAALHQLGLLNRIGAPHWLGFLLLLLSTQLVSYWLHRAFHEVRWLWPIHAVHHSDVDVDVSTSYRHHPLEPLISLPITAPLVIALGVSMEAALAYRVFAVAATLLSHSNVYIPRRADRVLRYLLLTPDYHRLHHCSDPQYTNSNYGSLVPWFDYLFGTARQRPFDEQASMELGLEYLREPRDSRLDQLLLTPLHMRQP